MRCGYWHVTFLIGQLIINPNEHMDNNTGEVAGLEKEASCLLSAGCHTKYRWKVIAAITSKLFSIRKWVVT